jgi:hypothetical protein
MTALQIKTALKLYKRYKTCTAQYKSLAESLGITTADLNRRCWYLSKGQQYPR